MSKSKFLSELEYHLSSIPKPEQADMIEDYVAHFEFGLQQGKTEELIARELGAAEEIALELVAEYYRTQQSVTTSTSPRVEKPRTIFTIIGLFLLNFVCSVVPLLLSLWVTWVSLALSFAIAILSPVVAVVDYIANDYFNIGTLFLSFILCGVSIFALLGTLYIGKKFKAMTIAYWKWNIRLIKGAE